jgi:hypothetical protein
MRLHWSAEGSWKVPRTLNGRVYDPEIGRFLSADPHVQDTANLQAWNRYSAACPGQGRACPA